jgi:hypothetical protein
VSRLRAELGPLFDQVYAHVQTEVVGAEHELLAAVRNALHRVNFADRQLDALRKRTEQLWGRYADGDDPNPLDELWNEIENDGMGIGDLGELRGLVGDAMKTLRALGRDLAKRRKTFDEILRGIRE